MPTTKDNSTKLKTYLCHVIISDTKRPYLILSDEYLAESEDKAKQYLFKSLQSIGILPYIYDYKITEV